MNIRASQLYRVAACPGSVKAESGLPDTQSDDAAEGTLLHRVMAGETGIALTDDQQWAINECSFQEKRLFSSYFAECDEPEVSREVEMEMVNINKVSDLTGHADVVVQDDSTVLIIDYKFGRIPVDPADENWQIMAYAVLAHDTMFATRVIGAIVQPRIDREKRVTVVEYDLKALREARRKIYDVAAEAINNPDKRVAGNHCKYCRALAVCPLANKQAFELATPESSALLTRSNAAALYSRAKQAEQFLCALKSSIFQLVQQSESENIPVPGLRLKPGKRMREITDAQKAVDALGIPVDMVMPIVKIPVTKLEDAFKKHAGLKGAAAKQEFESRLGDSMTVKQSEPSLELI